MALSKRNDVLVKNLRYCLEQFGDVSLSEALERVGRPGRPPLPPNWVRDVYIFVEIARDAGYRVKPGCDLLSDFLRSGRSGRRDFPTEFLRNSYRSGEKQIGRIVQEHRAEILKSYGSYPRTDGVGLKSAHKDWREYLRTHEAKKPKRTLVKTPRK
jgi:hypothetical protein